MNLLEESVSKVIVIKKDMSIKITIEDHTLTYRVFKVRLDDLYFISQNDCIGTWTSQFKLDNDIEKYNELIHKFMEEINTEVIKKTKGNIKRVNQLNQGVIHSDERIINGNKRLTYLR